MQAIVNGKQGIKYAGIEVEAVLAITKAAKDRSLEAFQDALKKYDAREYRHTVLCC